MIKVQQLNKYFNRFKKNEIHVLNDISLEFPDKGLVVLLGPSGSGKTTLLNVLGGLDKIQSGVIEFESQKIQGYDANTWDKIRNEQVGYVFQNYNLLPELSVYDNIAFVLKMVGIQDPAQIETRVNYILNAVNMYPFRKKRALQLSGGQQQRVAIARALVKNPRIIIADEPTGNLDSKNTLEIMNIIKQISMEKLVVLVTHEKDIATFYGDRIIELKDGKIINDTENDIEHTHQFENEDVIYLKDLNQKADFNNDQLKTALFKDSSEDQEPINVRFIVKNKTLYLDIQSNYKKVKLIDQHSNIQIKDEHYVKKTREELIKTSYDTEVLSNEGVHRTNKLLVSTKQILWMAFRKILNTSRRGKLMLFSFLLAGVVISFTVSFLSASIVLEPEQFMQYPKGYVSTYSYDDTAKPAFSEILALKDADDDSFYVHTVDRRSYYFMTPQGTASQNGFYSQADVYDQIKSSDLLPGSRLPENNYEALVSKSFADGVVKYSDGQEIGIWSYSHLLKESFYIFGMAVRIVGIVDTDIELVYFSPSMMLALGNREYTSLRYMPYSLVEEDVNIVAGGLPQSNGILISEVAYFNATGGNDYSGFWPKQVFGYSEVIYGVFDNADYSTYRVMSDLGLQEKWYDESYQFAIRSDDPTSMAEDVEALGGYVAQDEYDNALTIAKEQRQLVLLSSLGTAGFVIGFALIGFFFIIRSSLISRIYEISVYRALGVKKSEIFRSFLIEIVLLTTISTFVGYVLGSIAISKLQEGLLGTFNFFKINPLTFTLGLIVTYLINVLAGLFPVYMLLRKTPAQILSQYDI